MAEIDTSVAPDTAACGEDFVATVDKALASGNVGAVSDAQLARVMTAAVRLYAAKVDVDGETPAPIDPAQVTPTDIVVTVSQLIRSVGLNLWDLSMWFQRPQR
jgi:hypothetical protein